MDFKEKISKEQYLFLKAELKINALTGSIIRVTAQKNKGLVRYQLRDKKREQGQITRKYIWAITFLRGLKYYQVEPHGQRNAYVIDIFKKQLKEFLKGKVDWKYYFSPQFDSDLATYFTLNIKEVAA